MWDVHACLGEEGDAFCIRLTLSRRRVQVHRNPTGFPLSTNVHTSYLPDSKLLRELGVPAPPPPGPRRGPGCGTQTQHGSTCSYDATNENAAMCHAGRGRGAESRDAHLEGWSFGRRGGTEAQVSPFCRHDGVAMHMSSLSLHSSACHCLFALSIPRGGGQIEASWWGWGVVSF